MIPVQARGNHARAHRNSRRGRNARRRGGGGGLFISQQEFRGSGDGNAAVPDRHGGLPGPCQSEQWGDRRRHTQQRGMVPGPGCAGGWECNVIELTITGTSAAPFKYQDIYVVSGYGGGDQPFTHPTDDHWLGADFNVDYTKINKMPPLRSRSVTAGQIAHGFIGYGCNFCGNHDLHIKMIDPDNRTPSLARSFCRRQSRLESPHLRGCRWFAVERRSGRIPSLTVRQRPTRNPR